MISLSVLFLHILVSFLSEMCERRWQISFQYVALLKWDDEIKGVVVTDGELQCSDLLDGTIRFRLMKSNCCVEVLYLLVLMRIVFLFLSVNLIQSKDSSLTDLKWL